MICAYNYNIIIIAKFNFVKKQGNRWIDSAIDARFTYKTEHHYLIEKDAKGINIITPIDQSNTGVNQNCTTWRDGLQQFLQIKESLHLNPETLIKKFISSKAFLYMYEKIICGLKGTIGSNRAKELLKNIYNLDFVTVPRYKFREFKEYD